MTEREAAATLSCRLSQRANEWSQSGVQAYHMDHESGPRD